MGQAIPTSADLVSRIVARTATVFAYGGGCVVAAIGLMSAVSIIGRSLLGKPIIGDFELVEIGTAIAGSLFLPYCQASNGHIVVDFFTLRVRDRTRIWLDRTGSFMMAVMFLAVGWRTIAGAIGIYSTHETSMLMGVPIWVGYAGMVPGVVAAGLTALAQSFGVPLLERASDE